MGEMIAYCGIVCSECAAFKATANGDPAELARVAQEWTKVYDGVISQALSADDVRCQGCLGARQHQFGWCADCPIRACAMERAVASCGHCADYACDKVEAIIKNDQAVKARLDAIHATLGL